LVNLTINGGFKTDFNVSTGKEQKIPGDIEDHPASSELYLNKYHFIAGPRQRVKKFDLVLGIQYTWGRESDLYNFTNFSEPVEYIPATNQSLQGIRQNNMNINYNEISLFFGATYGFGK